MNKKIIVDERSKNIKKTAYYIGFQFLSLVICIGFLYRTLILKQDITQCWDVSIALIGGIVIQFGYIFLKKGTIFEYVSNIKFSLIYTVILTGISLIIFHFVLPQPSIWHYVLAVSIVPSYVGFIWYMNLRVSKNNEDE